MKPMSTFRLTALIAVLAVAPALAGSVRGKVQDAATLDPIEGHSVTLHVINPDSIALPAVSGAGGAYVIADVPPNNEIYILTSESQGPYANFYARIQDPGSGELIFDVLLDSLTTPGPGGPDDSSTVTGDGDRTGSDAYRAGRHGSGRERDGHVAIGQR